MAPAAEHSSSRSRAARSRSRARTRSSSRSAARPSSTTSGTTWPSASRCCAPSAGADPDGALPRRRVRQVVLPEAGARRAPGLAPDDDRRDAERHAVATRSWSSTSRTCCGPSTSAASGSTSWPTRPTTPSTPTSCASTSTRAGRRRSRWSARRPSRCARCSPSSASTGCAEDDRQPRHPRLRAPRAALGLLRGARRRGRASPASSSAGGPTCITAAWWKEERGARVFVDFNQNAPHKTVFGAWCVRARARRRRCRRRSRGTSSTTIEPDELTIATVPAARGRRGRSVGRRSTTTPQSLEPLLERSERTWPTGCMDAPWPPVYPKMPNEPPRVAPSRARKAEPETE